MATASARCHGAHTHAPPLPPVPLGLGPALAVALTGLFVQQVVVVVVAESTKKRGWARRRISPLFFFPVRMFSEGVSGASERRRVRYRCRGRTPLALPAPPLRAWAVERNWRKSCVRERAVTRSSLGNGARADAISRSRAHGERARAAAREEHARTPKGSRAEAVATDCALHECAQSCSLLRRYSRSITSQCSRMFQNHLSPFYRTHH